MTTQGATDAGANRPVAPRPAAPSGPGAPARRVSRWRPFPFHPILLAAYPILFLFSENLAEVALGETFQPIVRAVAVAVGITLVAGLLLRDLRRGALIASAIVIVWFTYGYIADQVRPAGVSRDIQLAVSLMFIVVVVLAAILLKEAAIRAVTTAVNVIALVLVGLTLLNVLPYELSRQSVAPVEAQTGARPTAAPGSRDIYYLVFDRYGDVDSLNDLADAHNDLPAWLETKGFTVAPVARANYGRTAMSLAATLDMTYLDQVVQQMGPDSNDATPVNDMLQDISVGRFLQEHGYRYIHIGNWFAPTQHSAIADENPVLTSQTDFGSLLDNTTLGPTINSMAGRKDPPAHHLLHRAAALFDFHELDIASQEPGPKFVLMHILLPHEPYVFAPDGSYSGLSEYDSKFSPDGLRQQLAFTNERIRGIVDGLLDVPADQQPIIIISADEGPYPDRYSKDEVGFDWAKATPEELETKYGVLLAMFLPGDAPPGAPSMYPDMSLINTWPIVLDRYFDAGIPLFPDRSYTSKSWVRPYDLTDITDRLDAIEAAGGAVHLERPGSSAAPGPTASHDPNATIPPDGEDQP